ncbi:MAG: serine/threonine-protein kinase [Rhodomicrobium sp.]
MSKLNKPVTLETAFGSYVIDEYIAEGGSGRVYAGAGPDQKPVAVKVLSNERATSDKKRRFKNEIAFLERNTHPNIVTVIGHGFVQQGKIVGPFYVMPRYDNTLRGMMRDGIPANHVLPLFIKILHGIEAAHLQGVVHRDLKPENILYDSRTQSPVIADFGIARFSEDLLVTQVDTTPAQRLANFQYAAPEQRGSGQTVGVPADIYALGLILNEMFTKTVPHGTDFLSIKKVMPELGFLDEVVTNMLKQAQNERPTSIGELKALIQRHQLEEIATQRLSVINGTVIRTEEIDEPLADEPPRLVDYDWDGSLLKLILDRPVNQNWVMALHNMPNFGALMGKPPQVFSFNGNEARVLAYAHEIQSIIDHFKRWLPEASRNLKRSLDEQAQRMAYEKREKLRKERELEQQRLKVLQTVRI